MDAFELFQFNKDRRTDHHGPAPYRPIRRPQAFEDFQPTTRNDCHTVRSKTKARKPKASTVDLHDVSSISSGNTTEPFVLEDKVQKIPDSHCKKCNGEGTERCDKSECLWKRTGRLSWLWHPRREGSCRKTCLTCKGNASSKSTPASGRRLQERLLREERRCSSHA